MQYGTPGKCLSNISILIVEDEPDLLNLLNIVFSRSGANVRAAGSVDDALELLERQIPDILISDLAMPGKDGYDLIRELRNTPNKERRQVTAIAMSAYTDSHHKSRAIAEGFELFVQKPVDSFQFVDIVAGFVSLKTSRRTCCKTIRDRQMQGGGIYQR